MIHIFLKLWYTQSQKYDALTPKSVLHALLKLWCKNPKTMMLHHWCTSLSSITSIKSHKYGNGHTTNIVRCTAVTESETWIFSSSKKWMKIPSSLLSALIHFSLIPHPPCPLVQHHCNDNQHHLPILFVPPATWPPATWPPEMQKLRQAGYPWKEHSKCSSAVLKLPS